MIVIVDYGLGNLASVLNMFKRIGVNDVLISNREEILLNASKILLPGVGAFDSGMNNLEQSGLVSALNKKVLGDKVPLLGICLGMQMLTRCSEEGVKKGLGWIDAETVKFSVDPDHKLKVPHMGWNYIKVTRPNPLVPKGSKNRFYFVHSYHVVCSDQNQVLATSNFGIDFTCLVNKENVYGAQFHPEKSLGFGMKVLENFAKL